MAIRSRVNRLTTIRPGCVGDKPDAARDEMFIDPSPYFSMRGLMPGVRQEERDRKGYKNPYGPTTMGNEAINRTRGKRSGGNPATVAPDETQPLPATATEGRRYRRYDPKKVHP